MYLQMPAENLLVDRFWAGHFNILKIKFIYFSNEPAMTSLEVHVITIYTAILSKFPRVALTPPDPYILTPSYSLPSDCTVP